MYTPITFQEVLDAREAIKDATIETPCVRATRLSQLFGIDLYLKLENLQHTNSFKPRGALNKLLHLTEAQKKNGVIACSAGNHAQGIAYHAARLGINATIVMPEGTPFNKIRRTEAFGAKVILHGSHFDAAAAYTTQLAEKDNLTFIHPFDDPYVVAGQGTIALEMLDHMPDLDVIVVPIGGGGMIAGVALAAKEIKPDIQIIGAQAQYFDSAKAAFDGDKRGKVSPSSTLAEGIAVKEPSITNIEMMKKYVDHIYSATEEDIEDAVYDLLSHEKIVAEGAAGAGLAVIKNKLGDFKDKKVGLIVCGGNIDSRLLSTLMLRGLVRDGRITRLMFEITDTPGQLSNISRIISEHGANIIEVVHQRMMQTLSLKQAELEVVIEARDKSHVHDILAQLEEEGFKVRVETVV